MNTNIFIITFLTVSLFISGCSKGNNGDDSIGHKLPPIQVSKLITEAGRTYVEVEGSPFPILGAQVRLDALVNCDKLSIDQIEAYFIKAKELGVNCIQLPFWWNLIEPKQDQFDFTFVDQMLSFANKYDLKIELLWFGSNMIGDSFSFLVPQYVLSNVDIRLSRNDEASFWNYYGYQYSLKLNHPWLLERESNAVTRLFDFIREWDEDNGKKHPVIVAQIHNEPDGFVRWRLDQKQISYYRGSLLSKEEAWTMTLEALDALGKAVKASTYQVITRTNVISGDGVKPYSEAPNASPADIFALSGIDMVSFDPYMETVDQIKKEVMAYKSLPGNYPLIAENKGSYTNTPSLMLTAVAIGGGYDLYDLATSKFFIDNTSPDFVNQIDHGIYTWDLKEKPHTEKTRALLKGFSEASHFVAKTPTADFAVFNVLDNNPQQTIQQTVSTSGAIFQFVTNKGALGFALDCGSFLLIYSTGDAEIKLDNGTVQSVETGRYINGIDFKNEQILPVANTLILSPNTLYRVGFTSEGTLASSVLDNIGL